MRSCLSIHLALGACTAIVGGFVARPASAALFTLTDANSVAQFDTATQANNFNWFVDGNDKLAQQAFWYREGSAGPEQSLHALPIGVQGTSDSNFDGNPDTLFVRYNAADFRVDVRYSLNGGLAGSGASDMGEQISITSLSTLPVDLHFFQYSDFDLSNSADTVLFTNNNAVQQSAGASQLTETVVTPIPSHHEAAAFPVILNKLNDAAPTTLNDTPPIGVPIGPGDMTWAYQWDVTLQPNQTFQISKDKNLKATAVPEPTTATFLLCLSGGLLLRPANHKRRI
jgi:hypothetical protein